MGAGKERKKSELNPFFDLSKGLRVVIALVCGDAGACECVA